MFLLFASCENAPDKKTRIRKAITEELRRYPQATLVDIYKFFFQGAFGPGHLIRDKSAVLRFLRLELQNAAQFDSVLWHSVGYQEKFFRLNLKLVRDGMIPLIDLHDAFTASANKADEPSQLAWQKEWRFILAMLEDIQLSFANFEKDKAWLEKQLSTGNFVVHHSETFRNFYHPHYRLVDKKHFRLLQKRYFKK
ncbi:MAG: hypothetical protein ACE5I1_02375 [bacterium]